MAVCGSGTVDDGRHGRVQSGTTQILLHIPYLLLHFAHLGDSGIVEILVCQESHFPPGRLAPVSLLVRRYLHQDASVMVLL